MVDFKDYKEEFDESFSKVDPTDFVKKMEDRGYRFVDAPIPISMRIKYSLGGIRCMAVNLRSLLGYIWDEPRAWKDEISEYVSDCKFIWLMHTRADSIRTLQRLSFPAHDNKS